jgi:uncharacterized protein
MHDITPVHGADGPYWTALAEGRLLLPRCTLCRRWHWPAVFRCGACGTWEPKWEPAEMRGAIYAWTRTWHAFGGTEGLEVPFVSVLVNLPRAGDVRLLGLLEGDATALSIGAAVQGRVVSATIGGRTMPALRWTLVP